MPEGREGKMPSEWYPVINGAITIFPESDTPGDPQMALKRAIQNWVVGIRDTGIVNIKTVLAREKQEHQQPTDLHPCMAIANLNSNISTSLDSGGYNAKHVATIIRTVLAEHFHCEEGAVDVQVFLHGEQGLASAALLSSVKL